jgi:hypothetical protein
MLGFKMENLSVGEVHGAFILTQSAAHADKDSLQTIQTSLYILGPSSRGFSSSIGSDWG